MDLVKDDVKKLFLKYFFPTVGAALVTSIYILFDTIFIGQGVGGDGLAALNIVLPIYSLVFGVGYLIGVGGSTVLGIERGRGHNDKAIDIFSLSVYISIASAALFLVVGKFFMDDIALMLGATDITISLIEEYMKIVALGFVPFTIGSTLQGFVRIDKNPKLAMIATITGGLINIILDYIFVFPLNMGMYGAGLATVLSYTISMGILLTHFLSKKNTLRLNYRCFRYKYLSRIISNGIPSFFIEMSTGVIIYLFNFQLLKFIGETGVTAYSIISNTAIIFISISNGICQTIQPIVSVNIGAKKYKRAMKFRKIAFYVAIIFGLTATILGFLFPEELIKVFVTPTEEIKQIAVVAIRMYFTAFIIMGANMVLAGYFQAIEMPKVAIIISSLRGLIVVGILIFVLPCFLGVSGIWLSVPITELITFIVAIYISNRTFKEKYV
ncbi:MATE family efflux transporter [Clostridium sp. NSJ-145]|uniref:MATE family efflux transporter n=1 Tax=Clostridium sp. NSJ-145 TaxID=2897777 RepID=UPI001E2F1622|nr:MATE family efflux transporter [Clostridium sp. NSJ-145]MCD2500293.1 MATE family efflux transporter [Clostridium sp. NSJ-145]